MQAATFPKKIKVTDVTFTTSTAGGGSGSSFQNSLLNGLGLFSGASYVSNTTPPRLELSAYGSGTVTNVDFPEYQTLSDIQTAGYKTLTEIQALGYQTIASLTTAGYKTAADTLTDVAAVGYQTLATLTSNGYKTAADTIRARGTLSFSGSSSGTVTLSNGTNASTSSTTPTMSNGYQIYHIAGNYSYYLIPITFSTNITNDYQVLIQDVVVASSNPLISSRIVNKSASGFDIEFYYHRVASYDTWMVDFVVI